MAGVTTQGFVVPSVGDLVAALNASWRSVLGNAVNVDPRSRNGQLIAALAGPLSDVWQLGEALAGVYANPSGVLLDAIAALTGTTRLAATKSTVTLTLTGTAGTVVALGKLAGVTGTTAQFATTAGATLAAPPAWASTHAYAVGARVFHAPLLYECITPGTSAGSGGPTGTGSDITDGTVHWKYLGAGTGVVDVAAAATVTGPVQGYAGTINIVATPVAGWAAVNNALDAVPGSNLETDSALRVRRATEAAGQGRSPLNAMRTQLLRSIPNVTSVYVFENILDAISGGVAAHAVECLVLGGLDADVASAIFANKAAGIATSGTTTVSVSDSQSNGHSISFSRPSNVNIYEAVTVAVDVGAFPSNGAVQIQDALAAAGNALGQGRDVYATAQASALFAENADGKLLIPGILDVPSCTVGTAPSPVSSSVSISVRQIPVFDTSRIAVTIVPGTP